MKGGLLKNILAAIGIAFVLSSSQNAQALEVNPEIEHLAKSLESQLQEKINILFGEDSKIVASVQIREKARKPAAQAAPGRGENDLGYLATPWQATDLLGPDTFKHLEIESVDVDLHVNADTDSDVIESVKGLATKTLSGYNAKVTVSKLAPTAKRNPPPPPKVDPSDWLSLAAMLGGALILGLGIFLVAQSLRFFARTLGDGLQAIRSSNQTSVSYDEQKLEQKKPDEISAAPALSPPSVSQTLRDYARNLKIVGQILHETPMIFVQSLKSEDADRRGIKGLLPSIPPEDQLQLKNHLGRDRMSRITEIDQGKADPSFDRTAWLQEFTERLVLKKVQGGSTLQKALSGETTITLFLAKPSVLIQSAQSLGTKAAWRILTEFLPENEFESLVSKADPDGFRMLLSAVDVSSEELKAAAEKMVPLIVDAQRSIHVLESRRDYYRSTLLNPVVSSVLSKALGEDDGFLDSLKLEAPDLVDLVREKVWTARDLARVPQAFLEKTFKTLPQEQKAAIIIALPAESTGQLEALLPEGNVRTIVLDLVKKARARGNEKEIKAATAICRQFLDYLRRQALDRKFELLPDSTADSPPIEVAMAA